MNGYQLRKARMIAAVLIASAAASSRVSMAQLPQLAASFTEEHWRTVSLAAGVPVADVPARVATIAYLLRVSK